MSNVFRVNEFFNLNMLGHIVEINSFIHFCLEAAATTAALQQL